jgi:adenylate kinase
MIKTFALAAAAVLLPVSGASAIGFMTQLNCASDYYAYCSQFQVGSKELRICMRRAGPKLSKACLNALIADGEVSKAEVERTKQELLAAKNAVKQAPQIKSASDAQKRKRTAVAKADDSSPKPGAAARSEKKLARENDAPSKKDKLTLSEQTFAALKQRRPKFIEEAAAEERPPVEDPGTRSAARSKSAPNIEASGEKASAGNLDHKKKTAKKSKSKTSSSRKKSKAKTAAKQDKQRPAKRSKRLAGD